MSRAHVTDNRRPASTGRGLRHEPIDAFFRSRQSASSA